MITIETVSGGGKKTTYMTFKPVSFVVASTKRNLIKINMRAFSDKLLVSLLQAATPEPKVEEGTSV